MRAIRLAPVGRLTLREAAAIAKLSESHLGKLCANGKLAATKIGRDWVVTEAALNRYLAIERKPGPRPKRKTRRADEAVAVRTRPTDGA